MDTVYLIVLTIEGKHYIELAPKDDKMALHAYETMELAIRTFDSFRTKAKSHDYESFVSGSMGIISIRPHIIAVPRDNPDFVKSYMIDGKPLHIKGKLLGAFIDVHVVLVDAKILEHSVFDVCKNIIDDVYGIR